MVWDINKEVNKMKLYNKKWTRREIEARVGKIETIGGVQKLSYCEGPESGVEMIQVRTGSGLAYYLNASRALDISLVELCGTPISWHAINGEVHPSFYDEEGIEWLRTAAGGLLMTCGLTQVGAPCNDAGESLGLHGRIHHIPARQIVAEGNWIGDEYEIRTRGVVEQTRIFGEHIQMTREIKSRIGENRILINDVVQNIGFQSVPHMILYHFNFGFPLMAEKTEIHIPSKKIIPRDEGIPVEGYNLWQAPEIDFQERVYYHEDIENLQDDKIINVSIRNPEFPAPFQNEKVPLSVRISWDSQTLPKLVEWKMPGAGTYVLGVEPANCYVEGRVKEKEKGSLVMLEPGESKLYHLELEFNCD
jgi:hypothetical protein